MAQTVRIDAKTYATLRKLADLENVSIVEELARAVRVLDQQRFFERLSDQYAALTPEERAEDAAELALWDATLGDGLDNEPAGDLSCRR